ncbi:hypothetical protein [Caulobacter phage Cr30]|uniref:transcriptional regulator n=1 Tax=Caulobacter phage Cr30 TaxID=1357714 RepID=UPI0004A9B4D8|nr:transcriptional regulator [Caulobacter phage Cr30]AGS80988.1 hypothetical protein [Caulobacter phage Cr30]
MPLYYFVNQDTQEHLKKHFSYDEMEQFLKENPNIVRDFSGGGIGDPINLGITRTPDSWKDVLNNVKKQHRNVFSGGTNINVR